MIRSMVLHRVVGVQCSEDDRALFGGGQGHRDGLEVTHLADQDQVGILAARGPQGVGKGLRVGADLALVDQALLDRMNELDRILDGYQVHGSSRVDQVDDRRQGGRLA